jgi:hypothetical protein
VKTDKDVFNLTNWQLFYEQKTTLIEVINGLPEGQVKAHLDGILNWIDNVQDYAVDVLRMDINTVFPGISGVNPF